MSAHHELAISHGIAASREKLYRCWTEPALIAQWFTPRPWTTPRAETDVRPGGALFMMMRSPEGVEHPNRGVHLEVVPNERIVSTDAYTHDREPSAKPFMTPIVTFEDIGGGKTRDTARARHWSATDRETHEAMGYADGWGRATDQLAELAATL